MDAPDTKTILKSKGHACFALSGRENYRFDFEYFIRDGEVLRASISSPIMNDGFRCGRFECYADAWGRFKDIILRTADIVVEEQ